MHIGFETTNDECDYIGTNQVYSLTYFGRYFWRLVSCSCLINVNVGWVQ